MIRSPLMTVMTEAVLKAARSLRRDFGEVEALQVSLKGPGDFVSAADRKAEAVLREALEKARPGYCFLMEESGAVPGPDRSHTWHIDPLDGTSNFLHGIPHFAVSVGLEREGQMVAGVVYDVIKDEMFVAEKGKGAFVNNRRLRVSARRDAPSMLIGMGVPHIGKPGHPRFLQELAAVMPRFQNVRRAGAAALDIAYVAAGRLDAFWERGLNTWDFAAGIVLVREAGGHFGTLDGVADPLASRDVLCANEQGERLLREALAQAGKAG
jgi:myo-inositol-1(or 4)-monophosphatase